MKRIQRALGAGLLNVLIVPQVWAHHVGMENTPAYDSPPFVEDLETVPLGDLPAGWSFSGDGSAQAVNSQNHTPGGSRSVELSVKAGSSAMVAITGLSPTVTGAALALRTPGLFGTTGSLITRFFDDKDNLISENTIDLATGEVAVNYPGGPLQGFAFTPADLENWRVDDIDIIPDLTAASVADKECWHSGGGTNWCHNLVEPPPRVSLTRIEVEITSGTGASVFLDDCHGYEDAITAITHTLVLPVPALSPRSAVIFMLLLLLSAICILSRVRARGSSGARPY